MSQDATTQPNTAERAHVSSNFNHQRRNDSFRFRPPRFQKLWSASGANIPPTVQEIDETPKGLPKPVGFELGRKIYPPSSESAVQTPTTEYCLQAPPSYYDSNISIYDTAMEIANEKASSEPKAESAEPENLNESTEGTEPAEEEKATKSWLNDPEMDAFYVVNSADDDKDKATPELAAKAEDGKMLWMLDSGYLAQKKAQNEYKDVLLRTRDGSAKPERPTNIPSGILASHHIHPDVSRTPLQDYEFGVIPKMAPTGAEYLSGDFGSNADSPIPSPSGTFRASTNYWLQPKPLGEHPLLSHREPWPPQPRPDFQPQIHMGARPFSHREFGQQSIGEFQPRLYGDFGLPKQGEFQPRLYGDSAIQLHHPSVELRQRIRESFAAPPQPTEFQSHMERDFRRQQNEAQIRRDLRGQQSGGFQPQIPRDFRLPAAFAQQQGGVFVAQQNQGGFPQHQAQQGYQSPESPPMGAPTFVPIAPGQHGMIRNDLTNPHQPFVRFQTEHGPVNVYLPVQGVPQFPQAQQYHGETGNDLYARNLQHAGLPQNHMGNAFAPVNGISEPQFQGGQYGVSATGNDPGYRNHQLVPLPKKSNGNGGFAPANGGQLQPKPAAGSPDSSGMQSPVQMVPKNEPCGFCVVNKQPWQKCYGHTLHDPVTFEVVCPDMRKHVCGYCGATGGGAHLDWDCPQSTNPRIAAEIQRIQNQVNQIYVNQIFNQQFTPNQENSEVDNNVNTTWTPSSNPEQ